jgi:hypothetical protein
MTMRHRFLPFPCLRLVPSGTASRRATHPSADAPQAEVRVCHFFISEKYSVIALGLPAFDGSIKILTTAYLYQEFFMEENL